MSSVSGSRRRTRDELEEDDSDTSIASRDVEPPKRPRTNGLSAGAWSNGFTNGTQEDEFQPGSIIRVAVENFVTYEKAEFFPGPNLNMVIGPNGTGKSTLVCAICLGLGYSPKNLGRAGTVKEFVKIGKDVATIEIELKKRPEDRRNWTTRVQIKREQNSQKWWLNEKEASHKNIQKLMRTLKIQVDNLCQFLPQDRVVEFAGSSPVELLQETLRAAAPEQMLEWQEELRELHKEKKELGEVAERDGENLKNLESRQQGLQADVDRIRERAEIEEKVKNLKSAQLLSRYNDARKKLVLAKNRKTDAEKALDRLKRETGPSLEAIKKKQAYAQKAKALVPIKERLQRNSEAESERLLKEAGRAAEQMNEWNNKINAERTGFEEKKQELAQCRQKITALQADHRNRPPEFNGPEWNQKVRDEEKNLRDLESEKRELDGRFSELKTQGLAKRDELKKLQEEIEAFDTQEGQQLSLLKKHFPEVATAWDWIQQHKDEFEKEVFGPPMVSCSIKDERYSSLVQCLLQKDDFTCIVAQTKNDYKKLTHQLYKVMSLSVNIRTCSQPLQSFRPPVNHEEAMSLGLDGFSLDFIEGPSPVLAMLCAEKGIHRAGVALKEHNSDQYERLVQSGSISQWAAGTQSNIVRRRKEYGPQAVTSVTKQIQPGQFWTSQPIDSQEKVELNNRLSEVTEVFNGLKSRSKEFARQKSEIDSKMADIAKTIDKIKEEKNALQREHQKWLALPDKIATEEKKKEATEQAMRNIRKGLTDLQYDWDEGTIARAEAVLEHARSLEKIGEAHRQLIEAKIQVIEAESDLEGLRLRNGRIMQQLEEQTLELAEAEAEVARVRTKGAEIRDLVRELSLETEEQRDLISSLQEGKTPDELGMEIDAEEAKLELIHAANPNVIREFEKRTAEILRIQKRMETSTDTLRDLTQKIEGIMGQWEPQLDQLVSTINDAFAYNFEQISCAGEVRVHKDPDFDQWALDIMVKFRENEELQKLNAHRQSGGERAVSTIFYLMALQSLAQSPFRVVDEINQGMDPRNERMVHERMVEIACREHTSQYFLVTPKLLANLRYDRKMRVLCIASGEYMPAEGKKLDFKRCLKIQKGLLAVT
ncbi:unnamed protein product [Clonostachys chloroleuca]|uniref:Structural maintenance of chromosomes protein 5 n=1 Tax=Clonostachys chloroleuca TaxID=1926264 RepID=A0AA35MBB8_9HYPO|nr:unnamed protein product [Clonostachys chloroleuca]